MKFGFANFDREVTVLDHFTGAPIEIHGEKRGNDYLCKKHKEAGYGYAANTAMMSPAYEFVTFTNLPISYYKDNNKDYLWVSGSYLKKIIDGNNMSNRDLSSMLDK